MAEYYGRVMIDGASIWIQGGPGADMDGIDGSSLLDAVDDFVSVRAHVNGLYAGVRVVTHDTAPAVENLDEWEAAEEVSVIFTEPPYFFVPLTERNFRVDAEIQDLGIDAGRYRVRCYTRGGSETERQTPYGVATPPDEQDADPATYAQQFRFDFWSDSDPHGSGNRTVLKNEKDGTT